MPVIFIRFVFFLANGSNAKIGKAAFIEDWATKKTTVAAKEASFSVTFEWDESMGVPGAFLIKNHHNRQFYLKTVELEHVPGHEGTIHFVCNSWVYPTYRYNYNRVFFANQVNLIFIFLLFFVGNKMTLMLVGDDFSYEIFGPGEWVNKRWYGLNTHYVFFSNGDFHILE